jgi:hypothetical protein
LGGSIDVDMSKKLYPLLLILCSGCTHRTLDPVVRSQPVAIVPSLTPVKSARTIEIQNDWNGYSDITPIIRRYRLRLEGQKLVGNAHVAVGGYGASGIRQQKTTKAIIPAPAATKFLDTLSKTPLQSGTYEPVIQRADDYPQIEIQIKSDRQQVIFSSQSQRSDLLPWKVTVSQQGTSTQYISNSLLPTQAFQSLRPYLTGGDLDLIIQRRRMLKK